VVLELGAVTHIRRSPMWSAPGKMPLDGRPCTPVVPVFPCFLDSCCPWWSFF
jgi:hypothetical protein